MPDWLKLSAPFYCEAGRTAVLDYLAGAPGNMDAEAPRAAFERALAEHLDVPAEWVIATNSCTAALTLACRLLDRGAGIEAPVLTWPATYAHAEHTLVDVTQADPPRPVWTDAPDRVRVAVALWGRPADTRPPNGPLVVDAAHSFGAHLDLFQRDMADAVCYSLGPLKEVPCSRGGALVSPHCADPRWRAASDSGTRGRHALTPWGGNFQMGEPECVLGLEQLKHADEWRARRQELLRWYAAYWSEAGVRTGRLLTEPGTASGHLCVALAESPRERELWRAALLANRIECGIHYELPLWAPVAQWPVAWEWTQRILSLPLHLGVTEADVRRIVCLLRL